MNIEELKQIRLYRQHLTNKTDLLTVAHDLNGIQAQFMVNAFHALKIRSNDQITEEKLAENLVKNWTVRGTVHIFAYDDLPLFKYNTENYRDTSFKGYTIASKAAFDFAVQNGYPEDILQEYREKGFAYTLTPEDQLKWSEFIIKKVAKGMCEREAIKDCCLKNGMTEIQLNSMFNSWGGGIRELCERGFLNYKVQEKKAFEISPDFKPMGEEKAKKEMLKRYLLHYAPATIRDAAYYFGCTQTEIKELLQKLPVKTTVIDGREYFYMGELQQDYPDIPHVIFLAGFDQLMLGYKKEDSIFLPNVHLRKIFNLAGIVMPSVLLDGIVVGKWRKKGTKLTLEIFESISAAAKRRITREAERVFTDIKKIEWYI